MGLLLNQINMKYAIAILCFLAVASNSVQAQSTSAKIEALVTQYAQQTYDDVVKKCEGDAAEICKVFAEFAKGTIDSAMANEFPKYRGQLDAIANKGQCNNIQINAIINDLAKKACKEAFKQAEN